MELKNLYSFVVLLILVGMLVGVGVLMFSKLETSTATTDATRTAVSNALAATADVSEDWLGLVTTIAILSIILSLVIGSFAMRKR